MEPVTMTAEDLQEYIRTLPDNVILRITIQEVDDGKDREKV